MALWDDSAFIISHLQNAFITSDDTGICEIVIETDDQPERKAPSHMEKKHFDREKRKSAPSGSSWDSGVESINSELAHSDDILPDMDIGAHRRRSNTAQRLERLKKEKQKQSKMKHVVWKDSDNQFNPEDFTKKEVHARPKQSFLTQQLEKSDALPNNPFNDYAKYDGQAHVGVPTKTIGIFLTMATDDNRNYPMKVVTIATAKVQDLIGLICWQYTNENRKPVLDKNIDIFSLHIAEDDGEVDTDFPSLDVKEPISKFGFAKLALVQRKVAPVVNKSAPVVTVHVPNKGFNKFQVESEHVQMKQILQKVLHKRKIKTRGLQYLLEKNNEPGVPIDLDSPLSAMDTLEFCILRENSTRGTESVDESPTSSVADSLLSLQYQSFRVNMVHKLRNNVPVQLGISGEKVEIDPVSHKRASVWPVFTQKAVTYDADVIASCDLVEEKPTGKSVLRLVYQCVHHSTPEFKHHDFETDTNTAKEIMTKISNILDLRASSLKKEYMLSKSRRTKKSQSFNSYIGSQT